MEVNHYRAEITELQKQLSNELLKSINQVNQFQTIAQNISTTLEEVKRLKGILTERGIITE